MLSLHQKLECFRNLCKIATADIPYLTSQEEDLLLEAARKLGVYETRAWDVLQNMQDYQFIVPEGNDAQKTYLDCTVEALIVKCDLPDQAYEWCLAIARLFALNEVILLKTIERVSKETSLSLVF